MWPHMLIPSGFNDNHSFPFTQLRQHIGETEWARREKEFYSPSKLEVSAERKVMELDKYQKALEKLEQIKSLVDNGDITTQGFVYYAVNQSG
ncbi:hypothetical protein N7537_003446 [Penicillium hordei]|uniref:Uncharacterized protein n=1 Tax=Penicillium hordei TaxID=40994 RepID=A0AAD6E9M6_9EURO|nr:uncharacterized protein N7537_003446 [Penicillium hordei]KAJ5606827.1 hypothetical protein N7537_003446 [Penicillium hordei]